VITIPALAGIFLSPQDFPYAADAFFNSYPARCGL